MSLPIEQMLKDVAFTEAYLRELGNESGPHLDVCQHVKALVAEVQRLSSSDDACPDCGFRDVVCMECGAQR